MTNDGDSMTAELLSVSATAYATCASNRFLEQLPDLKTQFGESAAVDWKDHFSERIRELSAAILVKEPALFVSRIRWSREAFRAREVSETLLRESLVCLADVLKEELPGACREVPSTYILAALKSFELLEDKAADLDSDDPISKLAMQYLLHVLEGNSGTGIKLVVDAFDGGLSIEDTYLALMTAQNKIGRMWHEAEINIAEEHLVTATTKRAMAVLAFKGQRQPANGRTVVAAAVKGNVHDIGVRAVSDFFELAGWRAVCLGGDLPAMEIAQAIEYFEASILLLSAALSTQLKAVRDTVAAVRELHPNCKIMVGGTALGDTPEIYRQLGADAFAASPTDAVATGTNLVASVQKRP